MGRILVVDDESPARALLDSLLRFDGHTAVHVCSVDDALAVLRSDPIDLVMVDLEGWCGEGYETIDRIRALPGGEHIPVIVMSAAGDAIDPLREAAAGVLDHLSNPCGAGELRAMLARVFDGELSTDELRVVKTNAAEVYRSTLDLTELARR